MAKRGLGRGLDALFGDVAAASAGEGELRYVEVGAVRPNPVQPRRQVNEAELEELAASIRELGVVQPVVVRQAADGSYELIAGERRWRAAKLAGLSVIPAVVREVGNREAMEMALVENLQREDLNPLDEALAFRMLLDEFGLTQEEVAERIGKSRPYIANSLRLLGLSEVLQSYIRQGLLTAGHARAILGLERQGEAEAVATEVIRRGLSVRATEDLVRRRNGAAGLERERVSSRGQDPELAAVATELAESLGTEVRLRPRKDGGGRIEIEYYSLADLNRLLEVLGGHVSRETSSWSPPA
ncbi:MAG: ParB/RepB/Spo0J family partition protein [Clostridia bacterium]|nr:MAG: ParB/RepB/Spo0J family partition protein [Clostridia bacterium]